MLRDLVKRALGAAGRTGVGKNLVNAAVQADPGRKRYTSVEHWPRPLDGFEDLAFLFSSNQLSHGIVSLQLDEAALLYRLARRVRRGRRRGRDRAVQGRQHAAARERAARGRRALVVRPARRPAPGSDRPAARLGAADGARSLRLSDRVHLVVGDSRTVEPPPRPCALVFVDGDHTYEGARADHERWSELVAPGGHLLFHDAVDVGGYGNHYPGIARLVGEIEREDARFERRPDAGSIAHFTRRP